MFKTISIRVVTTKSETLTTVSTMDACVSTEDEDFNDIEDDEEDDDDQEDTKEVSSWRDRCLHLDFVARIAQKLFNVLTERFFRKYSPRFDFRISTTTCLNSAQDWRDEDLPGDADGDPRHRLGCSETFPARLCWDASCLLDHVPLLVMTPLCYCNRHL